MTPQQPVPKPRRNKPTPPTKPAPIQEEEVRPSDTYSPAPSSNQSIPPQRLPVAPRANRIMMECDNCSFLNHEKSVECIDCENPRNEHWKEPIPGRSSS